MYHRPQKPLLNIHVVSKASKTSLTDQAMEATTKGSKCYWERVLYLMLEKMGKPPLKTHDVAS